MPELVQQKHQLIEWEGERGRGKDSVGGVKSNRSVVGSSRQFFLWFVLILFGL